ncbi:LysR family transcriptional regulator [Pelagibius sp.]|uniref:LysR family transcriptional regulator n=1 Tax=Pelagibius sp. TaxID=1931238 RepID=UPI0026141EDF|nr:LysR family transcriptional regulator [Pelagibius sp.]
MELKAIRLFSVLAEELHFGRAARRAGVTQSVLSVQIRRLEDLLGADLFIRSTREVRLTEVGAVFRDEALGILRRVDQATRAAKAAASGSGRLIRIGITSAVEVSGLMDRIAAFRATRPDIQVLVRELGTVEQEAALGSGEIDIGILHPPLDRPDLIAEVLTEDVFLAVFHPDFFDIGRKATWRKVFAHPLVFYSRRRAPRFYDRLIAFAEHRGLAANIVVEAESFLAAVAMAQAGLGVALLPQQLIPLQRGLTVLPLPGNCPLSLVTAAAIHESRAKDVAVTACLESLSQGV